MAVSIMPSDSYVSEAKEKFDVSLLNSMGLRFHPFSEEGQVLSFCDVPVTRKSYERLLASFEQPQKLPIVVGIKGSGKTMLMRKVSLARNRRFVLLQANSGLTVNNLLKRLALAAALPLPKVSIAPMEQTKEMLAGLQQKQVKLTVLVDHAHLLPLQTMAALVHCLATQHEDGPRTLEVALFGERSVVEQAKSLTLGGDDGIQVDVIRLQPLVHEDIAHYCFSRLRQAGWQGMMPAISKNISSAILERTGGLPAKINEVIAEHYFPFWLESWRSGQDRQARIAKAPKVDHPLVRYLSLLMLASLIAWLTVAPAWAMQYGSWVQACQTVFDGYMSLSDFLVFKIAHFIA